MNAISPLYISSPSSHVYFIYLLAHLFIFNLSFCVSYLPHHTVYSPFNLSFLLAFNQSLAYFFLIPSYLPHPSFSSSCYKISLIFSFSLTSPVYIFFLILLLLLLPPCFGPKFFISPHFPSLHLYMFFLSPPFLPSPSTPCGHLSHILSFPLISPVCITLFLFFLFLLLPLLCSIFLIFSHFLSSHLYIILFFFSFLVHLATKLLISSSLTSSVRNYSLSRRRMTRTRGRSPSSLFPTLTSSRSSFSSTPRVVATREPS